MTETDKRCEELIFEHIKKHYPDHKVCVCVVDALLVCSPILLCSH